jgi:hypothetical protein
MLRHKFEHGLFSFSFKRCLLKVSFPDVPVGAQQRSPRAPKPPLPGFQPRDSLGQLFESVHPSFDLPNNPMDLENGFSRVHDSSFLFGSGDAGLIKSPTNRTNRPTASSMPRAMSSKIWLTSSISLHCVSAIVMVLTPFIDGYGIRHAEWRAETKHDVSKG